MTTQDEATRLADDVYITKLELRIRQLESTLWEIMRYTIDAVIRVEAGKSNGLDATVLDNIARKALSTTADRDEEKEEKWEKK